eukprot:gene14201-biopygen6172
MEQGASASTRDDRRQFLGAKARGPCSAIAAVHDRELEAGGRGRAVRVLIGLLLRREPCGGGAQRTPKRNFGGVNRRMLSRATGLPLRAEDPHRAKTARSQPRDTRTGQGRQLLWRTFADLEARLADRRTLGMAGTPCSGWQTLAEWRGGLLADFWRTSGGLANLWRMAATDPVLQFFRFPEVPFTLELVPVSRFIPVCNCKPSFSIAGFVSPFPVLKCYYGSTGPRFELDPDFPGFPSSRFPGFPVLPGSGSKWMQPRLADFWRALADWGGVRQLSVQWTPARHAKVTEVQSVSSLAAQG